ncbi:MAG TPA: DUF4142 domain-containing protein [Azospirillaceae bacterium]|nr:DUF4142 domain-containing protein [Azospirillaceae bacterium]
MRTHVLAAALLAAASIPAALVPMHPAGAQQVAPPTPARDTDLNEQDRQFVTRAIQMGMAEVQLSELAAQRAENETVRQFGARMVSEHRSMNEQLVQLARQRALEVPQQPDQAHQQVLEQLRGQSGAQFDRSYMLGQVRDHQATIQLYEREAAQGGDTALRQIASGALPSLRQHLEMAQAAIRDLRTGGVAMTQEALPGPSSGSPEGASAQVNPRDLLGRDVIGSNGEPIGEVEDIVLNQDGAPLALVVASGGFLGLGEKRISIPFTQARIQPERNRVAVTGISQQDVEAMPEFRYDGAVTTLNRSGR